MTAVRAQVNEETNKNQLPWGHTNLIGSVYLNQAALPADSTKAEAPADTTAAATPASDVELEFWRSVKDSSKVEELNAYVTNYPNGAFKALALTRIAALQGGAANPTRNLTADPALSDEADQVSEDQIGLDRGQRRDVQRRLTRLGFDVHVNGQVRRRDPQRDQALAGGARLSEHRLPQQGAACRAAVGKPRRARAG